VLNPAYYLWAGAIPGFLLSTRSWFSREERQGFWNKKYYPSEAQVWRLFFQDQRSKAEPPWPVETADQKFVAQTA